ncbi:MAG: hypothetical protein PHS24_00020 [Bacilli bacterium]|nr:hypothetical protein [Bacilli bacterium]
MENVINVKEPNVIAIDEAKKVKFKESFESAIKNNDLQNAIIKEKSIQSVEPNISTPAELLANELSEPKIEEEVKVTPNDVSIEEENVNNITDQTQIQQEESLNNIGNDYVLGIINKITKIQGDLDSIGEDVIRLSNIYQLSKEETVSNVAPQVEKPIENIAEPVENIVEKTLTNDSEVPLITENLKEISPFSIDPGSTNIFDEPEQNKGLAA